MNRHAWTPSQSIRAFTVIELLVVIAIIGILMALVFPAVSSAKRKGQAAVCGSNIRQLQIAWLAYQDDNEQQLPPNSDQPSAGRTTNSPSWVAGWLRLDSESGDKSDGVNTDLLVGKSYRQFGSIGPYVGEPKVYRCTRDRSKVSIGGSSEFRVRSIAMNAYANGNGIWNETNFVTYLTLGQINNPSGTWIFIEEREDSINDGYFAVRMGDKYVIIDTPASYHDNGCYLSFADGHVEYHKWRESTTLRPLIPGVHLNGVPKNTFGTDEDMRWLTEHTTVPK